MGYWDGDEFMDGHGLALWLEAVLPEGHSDMWPRLRSKMDRWKSSRRRAYLPDLEEDLCAIGIHPGEIPDSLWKVNQDYHDGVKPGRPAAGTCRRGHARTPQNTYRRPDGRIECRDCKSSLRHEMAAA